MKSLSSLFLALSAGPPLPGASASGPSGGRTGLWIGLALALVLFGGFFVMTAGGAAAFLLLRSSPAPAPPDQPALAAPAEAAEPEEATAAKEPGAEKAEPTADPEVTKAGSLPAVGSNLSRGRCANGPGAEGADSYFVGEFTVEGNTVSGTEQWILFANPKWQARGGLDCSITWRITGSTTSTGSCSSCDLGLRFHAVADVHGSKCPEELVLGRLLPDGRRIGGEAKDFDQTYEIKRNPDGTAQVYFAKSGKLLGEGYHSGNQLNYVSAHSCKWF